MGHQPRLELLEPRVVLSPTIFTVNSTGSGTSGTGTSGTLPYVIAQANATTSTAGSEIEFATSIFSSKQTITLGAILVLSETAGPEVIDGPGGGLVTISGGDAVGVFEVDSGVMATLSGLKISGGSTNALGGGLKNYGTSTISGCTIVGNSAYRGGGGVLNSGTVTLSDCTISGNSGIEGGGVYNLSAGTATLIGCTLSGDYSRNSGGGLANYGTASLSNCTISGNNADDAGGGLFDSGTATLSDCTISDNTAGSGGGGIDLFLTPATLTGTIVAGNIDSIGGEASDISGGTVNLATASNSLIGTGGSDGLVNGVDGNIVGVVNPLLAPLGDYGGPTETMALLPGSPAIGAGTAVSGITSDQRGQPLDSPPDIGAFQSQGFTITPVSGSTPQQTSAGTAFAQPLAVVITANNPIEPVADGTITFTVPSSGASAGLTAGTAAIAADGMAAVVAADNSVAGTYTVTANATGSVVSSFHLTNVVSSLVSVYTVNSTSGGFSGSGTSGTLPYVVFLTNADANPATDRAVIQFDSSVFSSPQTITLGAGLVLSETAGPDVIDGPGAGLLTISGGGAVRVFDVDSGVTAAISGLAISGGSATVGGAGLQINGTATLTDCTISGNLAEEDGGALGNDGTTTLTGCIISGNSGGGVYNMGSATLINCTISGNSSGDGVNNDDGTMTIDDCTISGNSGGGLFAEGNTTLIDTIIAANTSGYNDIPNDINITGQVTGTNNLIGIGGAGGLVNGVSGNIVLTSIAGLYLTPLGDYGGPTETMALLPGSPAIGGGTAVSGITTDERGEPLDSPPDIGAFQTHGFTITPATGSTPQQTTAGTAFANPLVVLVTAHDPLDPVAGGLITFTAPSSGASAGLTAATATIAADGLVSVVASDNSIAGSYIVTASDAGAATASFNMTNLASALVSNYTVNSTSGGFSGSGTSGTLRYVIFLTNADANPATDGTIIQFDSSVFSSPQTITLGATLVLTETSGPDVIDGPGAGLVTVSGGGTLRAVQIDSGVTATLSGLTISGGSASYGGGLDNEGTATLAQCTISGNTALVQGGGLFAGGPMNVVDCTFSDDDSNRYGGGMYASSPDVMATGCTFSGNSAANGGGGVYNGGLSLLTADDCTFSDNSADFGGGLENSDGPADLGPTGPGVLSMNGCTISGNFVMNSDGGGLYNTGGTANLNDCTITGNSAGALGGGLDTGNGGTTTLTDCIVNNNSAGIGGGADTVGFEPLSFATKSTTTLTDCTISGNSAETGGGLASNDYAGIVLIDSTVSGNSAASQGGGLDNLTGGTITLTGVTVSGNTAGLIGGGGMWDYGGITTLTNCTISGNSALSTENSSFPSEGGGLYKRSGTTTLINCTISGNSADNSGGIAAYGGTFNLVNTIVAGNTAANSDPDVSGTFVSQGNNLIGMIDGSSGWVGSDLTGSVAQSLNAVLAPLANYGGPTDTMALRPRSPAIDAGSNAVIPAGVTTDQRGFNRISGGAVDIGAFESQNIPLVVNTTADGIDVPPGKLSLRGAIDLADILGGNQTITFDPTVFATSQTITLTQGQLELSNTSGTVTIAGSAAGVTISGGANFSVFDVESAVTATLLGLTMSGGKTAGNGGGLENYGTVTMTDCTISGNVAGGNGAGVDNQGSATLTNCTVSGNSAGKNGGGFNNDEGGTVTLTACTISGNSAAGGSGLYNLGTALLTDTMVAGNSAPSGASDIGGHSADLVTGTYNLIGIGGSGGITGGTAGNIVLTSLGSLGLAPLGTNGGPTETMALLSGSAAIGAGTPVSGLTTDQRGEPLDSPPDIGAFQRQSGSLMVSSISTGEPSVLNTPVSSVTVTLSEVAGVGSFGVSALSLSRNHGANLINSAVSIMLVSGSTYTISGLSTRTTTEGSYVLTINAADIHDLSGDPGTGSVSTSWLMDVALPTSAVNSLPTQTTSTTFTVSVTASDPIGPNGGAPSGVASIAIYDSTNGGPFVLFTTVTPSDRSAAFTGPAGNTYAFYSIATDEAGNVQSVPAHPQATITVANTPTPTPTPASTPTAAVVIAEQPLFQRKINKKGKPVGKPILAGFTIDFDVPLNSTAALNPANYQVDTVTTEKVKKAVKHILRPITNFTVTYTAASDAVMIAFTGKETFPTGGQITVLGGLTTASGGTLSGPAVYTISKGGKSIGPS